MGTKRMSLGVLEFRGFDFFSFSCLVMWTPAA